MFVRRGPAIVLSLVLGAAALISAPSALASDGGAAKDNVERERCDGVSNAIVRLKASPIDGNSNRFKVSAAVFSDDSDQWSWKLRLSGSVTDDGVARGREDSDLAFRVTRTMLDFNGIDTVSFRAENLRTGDVCRASVLY